MGGLQLRMERRSPALQGTRAKIDECLHRAKLAGPHVRVVPLTGDASTRQYFRILRPDNPSVVLAVYEEPFVLDELPFVNVRHHPPGPSGHDAAGPARRALQAGG